MVIEGVHEINNEGSVNNADNIINVSNIKFKVTLKKQDN